MIAFLRAGCLAANLAIFAGVPHLLGLAWPWSVAVAVSCFAITYWATGVAPRGVPAPAEAHDAAQGAAKRLDAPAPRFVIAAAGWTAAAVRSGRGYGLVIGDEVAREHREAVLAHEIAHYTSGDLFWEPFTDGPGRLILETTRKVPLLGVTALPFLVFGAPLARATELKADRLASGAVSAYPSVLREVAAKMGAGAGVLYPSLAVRIRHSARDSNSALRAE